MIKSVTIGTTVKFKAAMCFYWTDNAFVQIQLRIESFIVWLLLLTTTISSEVPQSGADLLNGKRTDANTHITHTHTQTQQSYLRTLARRPKCAHILLLIPVY